MNVRSLTPLFALAALLASQPAHAAWTMKRKPALVEPEVIRVHDLDKLVVVGLHLELQIDNTPVIRVESLPWTVQIPEAAYAFDELVEIVPSIYAIESKGQPQQLSVRGLSYGMNQATLDGIGIATVGNGSGERGAYTSVFPTQIGVRTSIDRSFSAESDGAVVGGLTNVQTRSAFGRKKPLSQLNGWINYDSYKDAALANAGGQTRAHWGGGMKATHTRSFGPAEAFGLVLSYTAEQDASNGARRGQDRKGYFNHDGLNLGEPDRDRNWDGIATPLNFGYGSYPGYSRQHAAAAKLEWQPIDSYAKLAILWFGKQKKSQTDETSNTLYIDETTPERISGDSSQGKLRVRSADLIWASTTTRRSNQGLLATLANEFGRSQLNLRAGYSFEVFRSTTDRFQARAAGLLNRDILLEYEANGLPEVTGIEAAGTPNEDALFGLPYALINGTANQPWARATLGELRADYAWNTRLSDRGFGFVTGAQRRYSTLRRDVQRTVFTTGQDMTDWLVDPDAHSSTGHRYRAPWLSGAVLRDTALFTLTKDADASDLQSITGDFRYDEAVLAGFFSAHYATDKTLYLLGMRYDRVGFDASTAMIVNGVLTDAAMDFAGGYSHWLPSFNLRHAWNDDTQIRISLSRTLGRPNPSSIAAAQSISCSNGTETDGDERCVLTRGNPELQPQRARNFDIDLQRRFQALKLTASLGWFHKIVNDNVFTLTSTREIDGVEFAVRQPMNLDDMTVRGLELVLRKQELQIGGQVLDSNLNASWIQGETTYIGDAGTRHIDQLVGQPKWMANLGLTWRLPALRGNLNLRVSARSAVVTSLGALKAWEDNSREGFTTAGLSLSQRVGKALSLRYEVSNLTNVQPRYLKGDAYKYLRQQDDYGRSFTLQLSHEM